MQCNVFLDEMKEGGMENEMTPLGPSRLCGVPLSYFLRVSHGYLKDRGRRGKECCADLDGKGGNCRRLVR